MKKSGMMAAVAAAAGLGEEQAESLTIDAGFIAAHFPAAASALREEGAQAEHNRLAGIEAASMPGHEPLIAAYKADRSKTPADAALAVIAAERGRLAKAKASLDADEEKLAGLKAASEAGKTEEAATQHPVAAARNISAEAKEYIAAQQAKGITVQVAEAVNHVSKKG
jgi:hypothetical protein